MDDSREAESIGYVIVLDDSDIWTTTINPLSKEEYLQIDLVTFDLWKAPAIQYPRTDYWIVVAILGEEFGCTLFMSTIFVESIPELAEKVGKVGFS